MVKTKKVYCIICGKYSKIYKSENIIHFWKNISFPIICSKCKNVVEKRFKE